MECYVRNDQYILLMYASSVSQMQSEGTYLDSRIGNTLLKPPDTNIFSSEIGKFSLAFTPGKNRHDPDGNCLQNILVVVKITPGQIIALGLGHEEKLRYFTKCAYTFCTYCS